MEQQSKNTNPELKKYYNYLRENKADVPDNYNSFETTLKDENVAQKYYSYLRDNNFDTPDTFESFQNTFGLKKKDTTSISTTSGQKLDSEQTIGSSDSLEFEQKPILDETGKEVYYTDKKTGQLKPAMEKVPKGMASETEYRQAQFQDLEKRAKKPIVKSQTLENYQKATSISDEEKNALQQGIDNEINNVGAWNKTKSTFRSLGNFITTGSFSKGEAFSDEKKEAVKYLTEQYGDINNVNPSEIERLTKEIALNKKIEGLKIDKNNEFLSSLDEEDRKALNTEQIQNWKTLQDKDKYIATKATMVVSEIEQLSKDALVVKSLIDKYQQEGREMPQEFIDSAISLQESFNEKANELDKLEFDYKNNTENLGSVEEEVDFLKRNYDTVDKFKNNIALGFGDFYVNVAKNLPLFLSDLDTETLERLRPFSKEGVMSEEERQQLLNEVAQWEEAKAITRENFKKDVSFENLNTSNFGEFFTQELGTQIPIFAQIALPGGVAGIGITSAANKYGQMNLEGNFSKPNMFLTSIAFGTAESVLGAMPTKGIMSRALVSFEKSGQRALLRDGIYTYSKKKILDTTESAFVEAASEMATTLSQNSADIMSGKKGVSFYDNLAHSGFVGFMLGGGMTAFPSLGGVLLRPFTDNKSSKQVRENITTMLNLRNELNTEGLSEASIKAINDKIKQLEKANEKIIKDNIKKAESMPKEVFDGIVDVTKKQELLSVEANDIRNDESLSKEAKKSLLESMEAEWQLLESKRTKLVSDNATVLDALPNSQINKLKEKASKLLVKEAEAKGEKSASFTDEQITKKAIQLYNESKQVEVTEKPTTDQELQTQPQAEVQEEVREIAPTENETAPTTDIVSDGEVRPRIEQVGEVGEVGQQATEITSEERVQPTAKPSTTQGKVEISISENGKPYNVENKGGVVEITDSNGKTPSAPTVREVLKKYSETLDFTQGESATTQSPETYYDDIAETSKNASEIAEAISMAQVEDFNEGKIDPLEIAIAETLGKKSVERSSFTQFGDINNITQSIGLQYFAKKGKGRTLDQIAMDVEVKLYGDYNANQPRVTEQDIVDFIINNPSGTKQFLDKNKNEKIDALKTAFTDVTGLPANDTFIEKAIEQKIAKDNLEKQLDNASSLDLMSDEDLLKLSQEQEQFIQQTYGQETINTSTKTSSEVSDTQQREEVSKDKGADTTSVEPKTISEIGIDILDKWDSDLENFSRNTLGINIPVVIARGAIKVIKTGLQAGKTIEVAVREAIAFIKNTDWYKNLDSAKQKLIDEKTFVHVLNTTIDDAKKSAKKIQELRNKIKEGKESNKQILQDIKDFLVSNSIDGVLTSAQTNSLINKANSIFTARDSVKAFDDFINKYNKIKDKVENKMTEKAKARLKYEKMKQSVLNLKAKGKGINAILNQLAIDKGSELTEKEKQMAEMVFKTSDVANMTYEEAKKITDGAFQKTQDVLNKSRKSVKETIKDTFKNIKSKFIDAQSQAKEILRKNKLSKVEDRMIALKGASGFAEKIFEKAYKQIYDGLKTKTRKNLDEIIQLMRVIAIDKNREERGLAPILHSNYMNGEIAKKSLEQYKQELGEKVYNDLVKRANIYFDEFRDILSKMEANGLISKETKEELFDIDYQPRKFINHMLDEENRVSENNKGNQKSSGNLAKSPIMSLEEGSVEAMISNSEWLLSTYLNMRERAMAINTLNSKMASEYLKLQDKIEQLKQKADLTKAEKKQIKEFEKLSEVFKLNPIIGVKSSGNPKYKYESTPNGYRTAYYYVNGVQHKMFIKEDIYEEWYNEKKWLNNPTLVENISLLSGSKLLKNMATGRNPFFLLTNIPRDFVSILMFSPEYNKLKPLAVLQLLKDTIKSIVSIAKDSELTQKYFEYGGSMSFLSTQGKLTGKSFLKDFLEGKKDNKIAQIVLDSKVKDWVSRWFDRLTLNKYNTYAELMFRISIFNRSIENSLKQEGVKDIESLDKETQDDIYYKAVASARGIMDFNQGGYVTKDLESVMPYLNAATQGTRVMASAFKNRPLETTSNMLQLVAMSGLSFMGGSIALMNFLKDDDDDETGLEKYLRYKEMVSPYDRRNYNIFFTGVLNENGEPQYIKIAKPQQLTAFTEITEHIVDNYYRRQLGLKERGVLLDKVLSASNDNISPIQFRKFSEDPSLIGSSLIARNPYGRAVMTYATGYDFYRQEKLSWDIDKKNVPTYMEGYTSNQVDDFYKEIGQELELSPIRTKAAVESILTSPGTNPYLSILYGGLDTAFTDKDMKEQGSKLLTNISKNIDKRLIGYGKDYNQTLEEKEKLQKEIDKIYADKIKLDKAVTDVAKMYTSKEISGEELGNKLRELLKDEPYAVKRSIEKVKDVVKFKDVPRFYIDMKWEQNNKVRALMLYNEIGNLQKMTPEQLKPIFENFNRIGFTSPPEEFLHEYRKLIEQYE